MVILLFLASFGFLSSIIKSNCLKTSGQRLCANLFTLGANVSVTVDYLKFAVAGNQQV